MRKADWSACSRLASDGPRPSLEPRAATIPRWRDRSSASSGSAEREKMRTFDARGSGSPKQRSEQRTKVFRRAAEMARGADHNAAAVVVVDLSNRSAERRLLPEWGKPGGTCSAVSACARACLAPPWLEQPTVELRTTSVVDCAAPAGADGQAPPLVPEKPQSKWTHRRSPPLRVPAAGLTRRNLVSDRRRGVAVPLKKSRTEGGEVARRRLGLMGKTEPWTAAVRVGRSGDLCGGCLKPVDQR